MRYNKILIKKIDLELKKTEKLIFLELLLEEFYVNEKENTFGILKYSNIKSLSEKMNHDRGNFSKVLKKLEEYNLIKIEKNKIILLNPEKYYYIKGKSESNNVQEDYISESQDEDYTNESQDEDYTNESQDEDYISESQDEDYISESQDDEDHISDIFAPTSDDEVLDSRLKALKESIEECDNKEQTREYTEEEDDAIMEDPTIDPRRYLEIEEMLDTGIKEMYEEIGEDKDETREY